MQERKSYIYIVTNITRSTIYIGVTSNLRNRINQHRTKAIPGFTATYNLKYLVYYEVFENIISAITREKELKGWRRSKKDALIAKTNPNWKELTIDLS